MYGVIHGKIEETIQINCLGIIKKKKVRLSKTGSNLVLKAPLYTYLHLF